MFTLGELAQRFGLECRGDAGTRIDGVATLAQAQAGRLAFLANPRYRRDLAASAASAVVLRTQDAAAWPGAALVARDPYVAFARIAALFETPTPLSAGVHPSAVVDPSARVDPAAQVGPFVSIGARSVVAAGVRIGAGCVIGDDCRIGADSELVARVTLVTRVQLGSRVRVLPGAVIGAEGFGLAMHRPDSGDAHWIRVPQLGGVRIGDDCEIGANTCIDRGALDDTVLEQDVRLDNQIQIGHNVTIGAHTAMAGCAAVAGSSRIGRYCLIAGGAGIAGHIEIGDHVTVTAMTLVTHSLKGPGQYSSGTPIQENGAWRRNAARFKQLDAIARRLKAQSEDPHE
jgi:UDP-3-O-[3-hydroxymyristoyl] glucosamine N-acyltransferase